MHRIDGPGHVNNRWVAEDAATNRPPTEFTAEFNNAIQEESASFIEAMGIALNKNDNTQLGQAIRRALIGANGAQCRLQVSGANLLLAKVKSGTVFIPGYGLATVPAAGVTLAPAGLTASKLYYIYAYMNGNAMALEASTTSHVTDPNTGIEVKDGDNTRLFVGLEWAASAGAWAGLARSWFYDPGFIATTALPSNSSTSSSSPVPINAAANRQFLAFSGESAFVELSGSGSNSLAGYSSYTWIGIDAITPYANGSGAHNQNNLAGETMNFSVAATVSNLTEGFHFAAMLGAADGGGTSTWGGAAAPGRTSIRVLIPGGIR